MNSNNETRYTERYQNHEILSNDVLDENKEKELFTQIRMRIKEIRKELKLTQREFGEPADIDRRYVAKVECGSQNPSFRFLRSISIMHKISLDWILYGVGEKYIKSDPEAKDAELAIFKKLLDCAEREDIDVIVTMMNKIIA